QAEGAHLTHLRLGSSRPVLRGDDQELAAREAENAFDAWSAALESLVQRWVRTRGSSSPMGAGRILGPVPFGADGSERGIEGITLPDGAVGCCGGYPCATRADLERAWPAAMPLTPRATVPATRRSGIGDRNRSSRQP